MDLCSSFDSSIITQEVCFDIPKALDGAWHKGLLVKLGAVGIRGQLSEWYAKTVVIKRKRSRLNRVM